jgi:hypothetical protein
VGRGENEFIRGPKWRTRTSVRRRTTAVALTFASIVGVGVALMSGMIWLLDRLGAPTLVAVLPWLVPTAGAVGWTLLHPTAAVATDDDDDSWAGYALRYVLVGEDTPRGAPARLVAAVVFGAPVVWALTASGLLTVTGVF